MVYVGVGVCEGCDGLSDLCGRCVWGVVCWIVDFGVVLFWEVGFSMWCCLMLVGLLFVYVERLIVFVCVIDIGVLVWMSCLFFFIVVVFW